jgi:hypothetical protein
VIGPELAVERVIGARHLRDGKPCQDEVGRLSVGRKVVVALADGHGSSQHAEVGANLAVGVALRALSRFVEELTRAQAGPSHAQAFAEHPLRVQLVRDWSERVAAHAGSAEVDLVDYGSTLLFGVATEDFVLFGQLGDGDILLVDPRGVVSRPFPADSQALGDETASLCQPDAGLTMRVRCLPPPEPGSLVVMSTDGYSKSYPSDAEFESIGPGYLELIRRDGFHASTQHLRDFLTEVTAGGSGDDIALALLYWPITERNEEVGDHGGEATEDARK